MTDDGLTRTMLVVRPWLGVVSGGDAFGHLDAVPMKRTLGRSLERYRDLESFFGGGAGGRKVLRLDHFRFHCQIDDRHEQSYAWKWGYQPDAGSIFGVDEMDRYAPSITALKRVLDRNAREDGQAETVGRLIVRLARALKLDEIGLLDFTAGGTSCGDTGVRQWIKSNDFGDAIGAVNRLEQELHRDCQKRTGKLAT